MKAAALVLSAVILAQLLTNQGKHFAILLTTAVCCMVCGIAMQYLEQILSFFGSLQAIGQWDDQLFTILLKSVGIGILAEITALICADSGNSAMGKTIHILSCAVILWLSLPLFTGLMDLITEIMGEA